ncbi:MAG TPA: acetate--CoA ligase family protein [Melioribacteraceae bacterium]|nr:acetate--CoA ligase family protein [Melioribacteraceae bacterium]
MSNNLNPFFYPQSIVVVGASSKEKSIGYELTNTILKFGYKGTIYLTNPKSDAILGIKCHKSIEELPNNIDLAIIVVPKQFVEESIDSLILKGIKGIVLITAGFKETGKEGEEVEKRLTEKISKANIRMIGPNCMGVISTYDNIKLNATFVAEKPIFGNTAFASQSGALGAAVLNSLRETDIRFANFISIGNKADINENDLIEYWQEDPNIKTISLYLESFVNGQDFIKLFLDNKIAKPVIILKAGKTSGGIKAASSHTGALSSSDKVIDALLKQFGVIRVNTINELFNTAKGFENFVMPKGNKVAVITNAGGPGILTVDSLEPNGLILADLSESTKNKLKEVVHPEGSVNNPIDLLPGGNAETYKTVNEIVLLDPNVDAVISIFVEPVMVSPLPVIDAINSINDSTKPIFQIVFPMPEFWNTYREAGYIKPLFKNPEDASYIITNMLQYYKSTQNTDNNIQRLELYEKRNKNIFNYQSGYITSDALTSIFKHYDIPLLDELYIKAADFREYKNFKYPIVVKGINKEATHKSDLGGVVLNITTHEDYIAACRSIIKNFDIAGFKVEQFLIQPFLTPKYELLIGGMRDSSFGPTISFGLGGKFVELFADTNLKSAYLCKKDIYDMINETKAGKMLKGLRGEKNVDIEKIINIIYNCALMIVENENIEEFDINPLVVTKDDKVVAIDGRIKYK